MPGQRSTVSVGSSAVKPRLTQHSTNEREGGIGRARPRGDRQLGSDNGQIARAGIGIAVEAASTRYGVLHWTVLADNANLILATMSQQREDKNRTRQDTG